MVARFSCLLLISLLGIGVLAQDAPTLPPCTERAHWTFDTRTRPDRYCVEVVWQDDSAGEMSFTGMAFAPDGRLFVARPLQGQVLMLRDTDDDTQPDSPQVIAEGLDRPNALLYHANALYIAGGASVYRLTNDAHIQTLTDDLPARALWNGGLATDGTWLYVGTGASCDTCADMQTGRIQRLPLDGGASEGFAIGFRQPLALLWHNDSLWATDSARPNASNPLPTLDELNQVQAGGDYGYPNCLGLSRTPSTFETPQNICDETHAPTLGLPTYSQPSAIVPYTGDAFPHLQGKALMVLMGSTNRSDVRGYGMIALPFPPPQPPFAIEIVLPYDRSITNGDDVVYEANGIDPVDIYSLTFLNRRGVGVWPHHLYGLAVSPEGWIYLSVGGGTILSIRPR